MKQMWLLYVRYLKPLFFYTKSTFIVNLPPKATILDLGCGNHSPSKTKSLRPDVYYVGADIDYYNLDKEDERIADELHIYPEQTFFEQLKHLPHSFDAIICAHVVEHVPDKDALFALFDQKLRSNTVKGKVYLSTPNILSVNFPPASKGGGTLNFYDDPTHLGMPLDFASVYNLCSKHQLKIISYKPRSRNFLTYTLGLCMELPRLLTGRVQPFTYQYWGFEDLYILSK